MRPGELNCLKLASCLVTRMGVQQNSSFTSLFLPQMVQHRKASGLHPYILVVNPVTYTLDSSCLGSFFLFIRLYTKDKLRVDA